MDKTEYSIKQERKEFVGKRGIRRVELLLEIKCKAKDFANIRKIVPKAMSICNLDKVKKVSLVVEILD